MAMRRATIAQGGRNQSGRETELLKPAKPIDNRPIRDQAYLEQCVERLHSYLLDWSFDAPPERLMISGLSLKQIIDITNFLVDKLDIKLPPISNDTKNEELIFQGLSNIFETLGYPETNAPKETELRSCSEPETYRKFLLFMCWLAELTDYVNQIEREEEELTTEEFIKNLCCSDDPTALLIGPTYFDFFAQLYEEFLQNPDEEALKRTLETNFGLWEESAAQSEDSIKREISKIQGDVSRLGQTLETELELARDELLNLEESAEKLGIELPGESDSETDTAPSFDLLLNMKERNLERLDYVESQLAQLIQAKQTQEIVQLNDQIAELEEQTRHFEANYDELATALLAAQQEVGSQEVQSADYEVLEFANEELAKELAESEHELELMKAQHEEKQARLQRIAKSIQQNAELLGLQPQQMTEEALQTRVEQVKLEAREIEQKLQEANEELQTREALREELETHLASEEEQADKNAEALKVERAELEARQREKMREDEETRAKESALKEEIATLLVRKRQLEMDLGELHAQNEIATESAQREAKSAEEDLEKLSGIVANLALQINNSRNRARDCLETLRDKIGEALKAYEKE